MRTNWKRFWIGVVLFALLNILFATFDVAELLCEMNGNHYHAGRE